MGRGKTTAVMIASILAFGACAWAQGMRGGMGHSVPRLLGNFKPVVGSGAEYETKAQGRVMHFSYVIVGKEDVDGSAAYWMEVRSEQEDSPGEMVMKQLLVPGEDKPQIKRMIMQAPGRPPMEIPVGMMMNAGPRGAAGPGDTNPGEIVGKETVTTPAGTFECDHYRKQNSNGTVDVWVSSQVSPYGTVKMTSGEMTMELEKVLTGETSHIKGEPQQMGIPGAPH